MLEQLICITDSGKHHRIQVVHCLKLRHIHIAEGSVSNLLHNGVNLVSDQRCLCFVVFGDVLLGSPDVSVCFSQHLKLRCHTVTHLLDVVDLTRDLLNLFGSLGSHKFLLEFCNTLLGGNGIHIYRFKCRCYSTLQAKFDVALLRAFAKKLIQLGHNILDLVSHLRSVMAVNSLLTRLLILSHHQTGLLCLSLLLLCKSLLALLLNSLLEHSLLPLKYTFKCGGGLKAEELLIVGVDAACDLVGFKLKLVDRLGVSRSLGESKLVELRIDL